MGKEIRCPVCHRATLTEALAYSAVLGQVVCPTCQANAAAQALAPETPRPRAPQPTPKKRSSIPLIVGLTLLGGIVTTVAILFCRSIPAPPPLAAATKPTSKTQALAIATKPTGRETSKPALVIAATAPTTTAFAKNTDTDDVLGDLAKALLPEPPETSSHPPATVAIAPPAAPPHAPPPAPPRVLPPPPAKPPALPQPHNPATTTSAVRVIAREYPRGPVTDEEIGAAIQRGVDYLMLHFKDGEIEKVESSNEGTRRGVDALCVYALATSSKAIVDPRISPKSPEMIQMIEALKAYPFTANEEHRDPLTYSRSLRACMLATFNRPQDRLTLDDDVAWLVNDSNNGGYTYDDRLSPPYVPRKAIKKKLPATAPTDKSRAAADPSPAALVFAETLDPQRRSTTARSSTQPAPIFVNRLPQRSRRDEPRDFDNDRWDNSNSQYGLLGVWAGAEVGCEVSDNYWRLAQRHWENCQLPTGEWNYTGANDLGYFAMTLAGIASLLVTQDYLEAPLLNGRLGNSRQPYSIPLSAGLAWLDEGDHCLDIAPRPPFALTGYNLFSMERVGLASGFKEFGGHNWFVELAAKTLADQNPEGSFAAAGDTEFKSLVETAYALLFLSRGRHPILANKLLYDGPWTNRPRDIANLTSYTSREMERPLNWQVVNINNNPAGWADAPILYISGSKPVNFSSVTIAKLKTFVDNGGLLFTHADLGSTAFTHSMVELSEKLFPTYGSLVDLPTENEIYKVNYPIALPRPKMMGVSNGVRLLMVHSPTDLSNAWQIRATVTHKTAYQLGVNLYLYATGKEKYRNRLDTPIIPEPTDDPLRTVQLARLKYAGNWNPEPAAWPRFARALQWRTGTKLDVRDVDLDQLRFDQTPLAHLTGTAALSPTETQLSAMKNFLTSGGTLLVDAAGGSGPFADAEASWLPKLLGTAHLQPLLANDPLLKHTIDGTIDVPDKTLRLYALEQLGSNTSRIKSAPVGKGRVIFSNLDLTSGLLGTDTWGILGYLPQYSEAIAQNWVMTSTR